MDPSHWRRGRIARTIALVEFPDRVDTLILGGGTTGAALAGLLAERSDETMLVIEAGPDYGPLRLARWPEPWSNGGMLGTGVNDWGYTSGLQRLRPRSLDFERARVIGGCSSHNGCAAIWGAPRSTTTRGPPRATTAGRRTSCCRSSSASNQRLRVQTPRRASELTPFQARRACGARARWGFPRPTT